MMTVSTGRAGSEATVGARFQHLFHSHPPTSWAEASHVTELQAKPGQGPDLRRGSWDPRVGRRRLVLPRKTVAPSLPHLLRRRTDRGVKPRVPNPAASSCPRRPTWTRHKHTHLHLDVVHSQYCTYLLKKSAWEWTRAVQTCIVQGSTVRVLTLYL